jgi:hypothetical protein
VLCVLVGVPESYVNSVEAKLRSSLTGCVPLSIPSKPKGGGWIELSIQDAKIVADKLLDHESHSEGALADGCCVIALASEQSNVDDFASYLEPTLIVGKQWLPIPLRTIGSPGRIAANKLAKSVVRVARKLKVAVNDVQNEFTNRLTRSPLHLPIRNFESDIYGSALNRLARLLGQVDSPSDLLKEACLEIEASHPFRASGRRRSFVDNGNKRFAMPGRDLHGLTHRGDPHNAMCVLSSKLRLGGALADGFHFDCVRNDNDRLEAFLQNCHDAFEWKKGAPHINIGCNDGLR